MRIPVGCTNTKSGNTVVVCDDGTAWMWSAVPAKTSEEEMNQQLLAMQSRTHALPHTWIQFHTSIPGTRADIYEQEAKRAAGESK